jgi:hypothetical protein
VKPVECKYEQDVLAAVMQSRWPEQADAELRAHAAGCAVCSDLAAVAGAFDGASEELRASAEVPDAGRVWRRAQVRARREAIEAAGRPITAAHVIAFACAMGLLGACIGATSTWFQAALRRVASGVDWAGVPQAAAQVVAEHGVFVVGLGAVVLLVPTAVVVVLGRE